MEEENSKKLSVDAEIEAILFFKGEPVSIKKLAEYTGKNTDEISEALNSLNQKFYDRGLCLIRKEDEVMIGTSKLASAIIEKITKEELSKDIGKAGLETLSIILYKGPISRREIDYIRGVNSNFILRNLMIRGLVEKVQSESDQRQFLYKPTIDLFSFLGITKIEDLPEFEKVKADLESYKNKQNEYETKESSFTESPAKTDSIINENII